MMMDMRRYYRHAVIVTIASAALAALIEPRRLPVGVAVGGVLAIINIRGLSKGLYNLLSQPHPARRLFMAGTFRLMMLATVITLLAYYRLVDLLGLLAGFAVASMVLVIEGLGAVRREAAEVEGEELPRCACDTTETSKEGENDRA